MQMQYMDADSPRCYLHALDAICIDVDVGSISIEEAATLQLDLPSTNYDQYKQKRMHGCTSCFPFRVPFR